METLGEDLWAIEDTMQLAGGTLRLRMTIVRLVDGRLWVHSPVHLSPDCRAEIDSLGTVGVIVGPNNAHNLWLKEWSEAYPNAEVWLSPGIPAKLKIARYSLLGDNGQVNPWPDDFDAAYMGNVPFFNETVFLHKASRSLLVTDIVQNHSDPMPGGLAGFIRRFVLEPIGFRGMCLAPPLKLSFVVKDRPAFEAFILKVRCWQFDRIVVTHGDVITDDAQAVFRTLTHRFVTDSEDA